MAKEDQTAPETTKKSLLVPILLGTNALSLAGVGAALFLTTSQPAAKTPDAPAETPPPVEDKWGTTVDVGNFTINLSDPGSTRYLKAVVKAAVSSDQTKEEVELRNPQLRDVIISYLSSLQLRETQGARSKEDIRENLRKRINNLLRTGEVKDIFFTEFVTQ